MLRLLLIVLALIACAYARPLDDALATGDGYSNPKPNGSYFDIYRTFNGISTQERGVGGKRVIGGYYSYSPEGELIKIIYIVEEVEDQPQYFAHPGTSASPPDMELCVSCCKSLCG
ncbi:hypothetical protein AWZ03_000708 [Drosophila navojoa]|uniref:Uncharacterized protein n=1 Tax=Drosophila navojoa TaxID=7232 RepID=A0A484C035_DRONA|nr:hypothetical protein AWZ03_000708 [Drosophila navojoa]